MMHNAMCTHDAQNRCVHQMSTYDVYTLHIHTICTHCIYIQCVHVVDNTTCKYGIHIVCVHMYTMYMSYVYTQFTPEMCLHDVHIVNALLLLLQMHDFTLCTNVDMLCVCTRL